MITPQKCSKFLFISRKFLLGLCGMQLSFQQMNLIGRKLTGIDYLSKYLLRGNRIEPSTCLKYLWFVLQSCRKQLITATLLRRIGLQLIVIIFKPLRVIEHLSENGTQCEPNWVLISNSRNITH